MILVFGGSFNGKLDFVLEEFGLTKDDVYFCKDENIKLDKKIIYNLEEFTYKAISLGMSPLDILKSHKEELKDKIVICDDISSGVVPIDKTERIWRESTGKCLQWITKNSDKVYRVFFGIGKVIKDE
ncbi:bifunctional adenosylcobinamide kinase/adenosylcobinamide-phosphate guanylyltransferase [Clostridium fallax]|uniref:Adenosylcobinamide kinase /adenosylcobinamide-phosphate guanylyltransferase n=1 Tax=Clostridium fallax TaxID=1533 RepID=A0A1M4Y323_9CLOT|nr:bifunctional adenosylcobinamide kinase/adenosylcobinamide-phosphate guanylyltransferase [Clostridium fallax]SHF00090.1 adenosylcobinamide kinase /adenosylcobinamide-phosphate guanylyltransferase [Clostridium fallax]SQB07794.1 cobalamin biosynthesis protein CobU [Clostridium fallax]